MSNVAVYPAVKRRAYDRSAESPRKWAEMGSLSLPARRYSKCPADFCRSLYSRVKCATQLP